MSKNRKTKKEKIRAAVRLAHAHTADTLQTSPVYTIDSSIPIQTIAAPVASTSQIHYGYVTRDMKKTLFITSLLLGASLILHFFLQNNLLHLGFFGY